MCLAAHRPVPQHDARHDEGDGADGKVDVEDPAPGGMVDEESANEWSGNARNSENCAEITLVPATLGGRDDVADDRHREHDQPAGPEALHGSERDQLVHVLAQPRQSRSGQEDDDGELEDALATVEVGDLSVEGAVTVEVSR